MGKRKRLFSLYSRHYQGNVIGILIVMFLVLVRLAQSVRKAVPDTSGTSFWFTTPLCSSQHPAYLHAIPQSTDPVNITIVSLDASVAIDNEVYTVEKDGVLYIPLPCSEIPWGHLTSSGFYLTSTAEVAVNIDYKDDNHVVIPTDVTGYKYIVTSPQFSDYQETFFVIHGNTSTVNIVLPTNLQSTVDIDGVQYSQGSSVNLTLPVNGVLGISCSCDLTGAMVTSDLPVNILSGARRSSSQEGYIEDVPPFGAWGRRFIFSSHPWVAENVTLVIQGQTFQAGLAITTGSNTNHSVFSDSMTLTLPIQLQDFLFIESNVSVLCAVIYSISDKSSTYHTAFRYLTPMVLYHTKHRYVPENSTNMEMSVNVILKQISFQNVYFNSTSVQPFNQMTYFRNYFISKNIPVSFPGVFQTVNNNNVPLHGTIFCRSDTSAYEYISGMRIVNIYDACVNSSKSYGGNGDGIDNDCDNLIDEETLNKIDDDNDGLIDEDVRYAGNVGQSRKETVWEYHIRNAIKEKPGPSLSLISIVISIGVALTSVVCFIGGMLLFEKIRRNSSSTRVTPIF